MIASGWYKEVVVKDDRRQGEDWVEKVSSVLAGLIGLPRADVELATRDDTAGCLVRDVKPHQWQLFSGADLLAGLLGPTFDPNDRLARGHNIANVKRVLAPYGPPPGAQGVRLSAFDYFAGYLLFDATIANRDRHPKNWAVLQAPLAQHADDSLCPSFDHASGLGFGMSDRERERWLDTSTVDAWVRRGTAKSFEHGDKPWPSLVDVAVEALVASSEQARVEWRQGLESLSDQEIARVVADIPGLSDVTSTFTRSLVMANRQRLLQEAW